MLQLPDLKRSGESALSPALTKFDLRFIFGNSTIGPVNMQSLTPVIFVEDIEPCLQFWFDLGFEKSIEVPTENKLGFVGLASHGVEIMYQSRASLADDLPQFSMGTFERSGNCLYVRVGSLDPLLPVLQKTNVIVPERNTFYGAREIGVRAPCGSNVIFAEFGEATAP